MEQNLPLSGNACIIKEGHSQVRAYAAVMGGQDGKPCGWGPSLIIGAPKVQVSPFLLEPDTSCMARAKKKKKKC